MARLPPPHTHTPPPSVLIIIKGEKNARNFHRTMPERAYGTICSSGEQPCSTSSPTWLISVTMMPDWTFQKWYIKPFWVGVGVCGGGDGCPFLLRSERAAVKPGTKVCERAESLQPCSPQVGLKARASVETPQACSPQWTAQCPRISAVFGWGQKWGIGWVPTAGDVTFTGDESSRDKLFFHSAARARPCGAIQILPRDPRALTALCC